MRSGRSAPAPRRGPSSSSSCIAADIGCDDLDPHDVAEAASADLELDRLEQVVGLVGDLEVGVARDAEDGALADLHAREEPRRGSGRSPPRAAAADRARPTRTKRGSVSGTLMRAKRSSPVSGSRTNTPEGQREPRDVRERLARPDGERRQHGIELAVEERGELRQLLVSCSRRTRRRRCPRPRAPAAARRVHSGDCRCVSASDPLADRGRAPACGVWPSTERIGMAGLGLTHQAADANHEELVEVRREDGAELDALEQRHLASAASSSTRALKSSHESSRFSRRSAGRARSPSLAMGLLILRTARGVLAAAGSTRRRDRGVPAGRAG